MTTRSFRTAAAATFLLARFAGAGVPDHEVCSPIKDDAPKGSFAVGMCTAKAPASVLCRPASKENVVPAPPGAPVGPSAEMRLCYKIKCPKLVGDGTLDDQFGSHDIGFNKAKYFCTAATVVP